jgi:disulfide bond formation protein DsbB
MSETMRALPVTAAILILSILVIGAALFSQYGMGLVPCELCLLQRWPWYVAIALSALLLALFRTRSGRVAALLFATLFVVSSGFATYHVGVEQHIFAGPDACTAPALSGGHSPEELLERLRQTPVIRCDVPQWEVFGISLAGFNLIASVLMVALCLLAWRRGGTFLSSPAP